MSADTTIGLLLPIQDLNPTTIVPVIDALDGITLLGKPESSVRFKQVTTTRKRWLFFTQTCQDRQRVAITRDDPAFTRLLAQQLVDDRHVGSWTLGNGIRSLFHSEAALAENADCWAPDEIGIDLITAGLTVFDDDDAETTIPFHGLSVHLWGYGTLFPHTPEAALDRLRDDPTFQAVHAGIAPLLSADAPRCTAISTSESTIINHPDLACAVHIVQSW